MKKVLLILSLVALLVLAGCTTDKKTITTNGQAKLSVQADEAVITVTVETLDENAEVSKTKNAEITDKVYAALYKLNIPRENIETSYYNIYEEFDWSNGSRKSLGYKTTHGIKITTKDFNLVGQIVDETVDAGAVRVEGINFDLSQNKKKELKQQALAEAAKDAKNKAEAMVSGVGGKLGDVVSISDADYNYQPYPLYAREQSAATLDKALTQISPQKLEVYANVQVVYEID